MTAGKHYFAFLKAAREFQSQIKLQRVKLDAILDGAGACIPTEDAAKAAMARFERSAELAQLPCNYDLWAERRMKAVLRRAMRRPVDDAPLSENHA